MLDRVTAHSASAVTPPTQRAAPACVEPPARPRAAAAGEPAPAATPEAARGAAPGATLDRLLSRAVEDRARARRPVLQRLIAVNVAGTPHTDYAIMKQVHQLRASQAPAPHAVTMLSSASDFSGMQAGEELFIVSHGSADTGNLRDVEPSDLIKWLNHGTRGVPKHIGKIVVLSCYGGMVKSGGQSLAQKIASGLKHREITVEGALGFSFGTPEFAQGQSHSSVLSEDLRVFYRADSIDDMCSAWKEMLPTHGGGVLTQPPQNLDYVDEYASIKTNLVRKHSAKAADGMIRTLITHFQTRAKAIEAGLAQALGQTAGTTVQARIATLEAPAPVGGVLPPNVVQWNALLAEQYQLFQDYYLWTNPDDAFAAFVS